MRTAIVSLGICLAITASAGNITVDQATRVAENYLTFMTSVNAWDGVALATATLERTLEWNGEIIGYYFEVDPDGFLLIPAFRELPPIKTYSEHGRLRFDHPESFGVILESVLQSKAATLARYPDLASMADDGIDTTAISHYEALWEAFTIPAQQTFLASLVERELDEYTPGTFLIESSWHQGSPYNYYCPIIDQHNCWVGCVATAVTQIMNYWQWPLRGEGAHSYTWENQTLYADFRDPYDWENILPSYGQPGDHTLEEIAAIAELSYEYGVSVEMNYGLDGSGILTADIQIVIDSLRDYFRYQDIMDIENRNQYENVQDWFNVLVQEIDLERPMFYYIYGHVIVCDGWQISNSINQIHINYGVGGSANSWYALDEIPGSDDPNVEFVIRYIEPLLTAPPSLEWDEQLVSENFDAASSVYAEDIDGDGDIDIVAAAYIPDTILWWENLDGNGTNWSEHTVDGAFNGAQDVYATDMDGDGDTDILGAAANADDITWWENANGAGTSWSEHTVDAGFDGARSVCAADIDGDGDTDILGAAANADDITWWENLDGTGNNWSEHIVDGAFNNAYDVCATDVDADGDIDILGAANYDDEIAWWENLDGTGTNWIEHTVGAEFDGASSVYAADVDGDDDVDMLGAASMDDEITWWENIDGIGTNWSEHTVTGGFDGANCIYAADLDGDGDMDLLGSAYNADDISWWENLDGTGMSWSKHRVGWLFDGANSVQATDINSDGDIDMLGTAYIADDVTLWIQTGSPGPPDPVVINITPAVNPTVVSRGGWFEYDLQMDVNINQPANGYVWTMATLPNGLPFGPIFDVQFNFAPGMSISVEGIQQYIVSYAPLGTYEWIVNVGPNLFTPIGSDSFPFTVVAANAISDQNLSEWTSVGHERILIAAGADPLITEDHALPQEYSISQARPNPFNPTTTLSINLPEAAELNVQVFNIAGQQVEELASGSFNAGIHNLIFDASDMASGIYFVRATVSGKMNQTQKVMLLR